ncbi:hypothetical protein JR316_0007470 [Psilocybe cubensis]|uniref:SH3 domain-containing protein n=2 Tax=Psilocybe cubensis TaxID=181762 RepID=A0A8H8CGT9_PSICU|nr:hypothetical protein JR316_0007470 [Psilocybe cubensis]KAH9480868.1 hypothetical protein JR316_0007470 [Psilocybe cubensis]
MRVIQRQASADHVVIGRALADKTTVEAREPQLLKLPIPLPSVPVLSPLLSPVVGGSNSNQNSGGSGSGSGSSPTTATSPPTQTTSSGGNSGGTGGGSTGGGSSSTSNPGGGGSSGSGGNGGSTSSGGSSSSGGGSSSDPSSGGGATSSGSTSSGGSGSSGSTGDTSTSGDTSSSTSSSQGDTAGNTSTPGGIALTSGGSSNDTSTSDGETTNSNGSGSTQNNDSADQTTPGAVANAGGIVGTNQAPGAHSTNGKGIPNATLSGGKSTSTGIGGISSGPDGSNSSGGNTSSKHGLSGGAIAGISILLLALLVGLVIFAVRRRTRSQRHDQANRWWFTGKRNSQTYGDRNSKEIIAPGVRTARSSFATTVDHSNSSHGRQSPGPLSQDDFIIPPLPPMAEIGRANGNVPALTIDVSHFAPTPAIFEKRVSTCSQVSGESTSEYLVVHHRDSLNPGTPMSVRPFSPSESFSFPRPPDPVGDRNSAYSRPSSSGTLAMLQAGTHFSFHSSNVPPTPGLPTLIVSQDNPINNVTDPFADNNPFEDPGPSAAVPEQAFVSGNNGGFAETEFICRPFVPTLSDELAVRPDDPVRILTTFDDGWALVEKIRLDTNEVLERGLIPIDCLRAPGQPLPAFFAAKRVSSYAGSVAEVHAM